MKHDWQERTRAYYEPLLAKHGPMPAAVDAGSQGSLDARYHVLWHAVMPFICGPYDRLVDVGCGYGAFLHYLRKHDDDVIYHGVDISERMIDMAREQNCAYSNAFFHHEDITRPDIRGRGEFSAVVASGIFQLQHPDNETYVVSMIDHMWQLTERVLAFNMLSIYGYNVSKLSPEALFDPARILSLAMNRTRRVTIDHSYLPHDFTVIMERE